MVSNADGNATSNAATLTVNASTDVLTQHNDIARTGQNLTEKILTTTNVTSATFGKLGFYSVDGLVDAQPLYVSNVAVPSKGTHEVLIVATEHDSVYAFDADSGTQLWKTSMLKSGETTSDTRNCNQVTPEIGVTATPVIDRTRGANGVVYVAAMSKDGSGNYHQRIHALDLALGTELFSGPVDVQATLSRNRRQQPRRQRDLRSRPIRRARRAAADERHRVHGLDFALRHPPVHRMDHRLQRRHAGADQRAERDSERQRRRHLDGRCGTRRRQFGKHLFPRRQRRLRYQSEWQRLSQQRRLRQRLHEALDFERTRRGRLFRDVQPVFGERQRHRPRLRRRDGAARSERRCRDTLCIWPSARAKTEPLRGQPRQHGQVQLVDQQRTTRSLNGVLPDGVWAMPAYFNNTRLLRIAEQLDAGLHHHECEAVDQRHGAYGNDFPISRRDSPASRRTAPATELSGRWRTAVPRCCMPTMPPH